jgi:uncharacterized SAM-binding protein YcdF (DUF218 family)
MRSAARRTLLVILVTVLSLTGLFLYYGGRYLQHEDSLQKADGIFVLAGMRAERWVEAYELYQSGYAPVVVLSPGRSEPAERMLRDRGIRFPADVDLQRDALVQMGVPDTAIVRPGGSVDNTAEEANLLRTIVQARGWRRVIVVTSKYHARRSGFAVRRALEGTGTGVVIRASRYDPSDPARWWHDRADVRFVLMEWEKLLAYRLGAG